jgi:hypothetical protein
MALGCINVLSPEFLDLKKQTGLNEHILAAKIQSWQDRNNRELDEFPTADELGYIARYNFSSDIDTNTINYNLKVVDTLIEIAKNRKTIRLNTKDKPYIEENLIKALASSVPKAQIKMVFDKLREKGVTSMSIDQLITDLLAENSFTVEVNTATQTAKGNNKIKGFNNDNFDVDSAYIVEDDLGGYLIQDKNDRMLTPLVYKTKEKATKVLNSLGNTPTQYYSNLTVPGGTNYTESEIATPGIIPNIKGHADFSTDNGIGWFRSDEQSGIIIKSFENVVKFHLKNNGPEEIAMDIEVSFEKKGNKWFETFEDDTREISETEARKAWNKNQKLITTADSGVGSKTRRVLEVQSDLFQKGRDKKDLINTVSGKENQFLQLLNKDNTWVTFFVKSILQDSARRGYEKVLFPTGKTAAKVEGHETIADEINKINEDIDILNLFLDKKSQEKALEIAYDSNKQGYYIKGKTTFLNNDITHKEKQYFLELVEIAKDQLETKKQEMKTQRLEKLKPVEAFYTNRVTNILNKLYDVKQITDEHGNTWNEVTLEKEQLADIAFSRTKESLIPETKTAKPIKVFRTSRAKDGQKEYDLAHN